MDEKDQKGAKADHLYCKLRLADNLADLGELLAFPQGDKPKEGKGKGESGRCH
jgi:hypothetical protein